MSHVDDCKKFIECLSAHFDGELEPELEAEFMLHYRVCARARTLVRTFERTIVLHRHVSGKPVPRDIHERLLRALEECRKEL